MQSARLAEILGTLSLATDVVNGFAQETALRTAMVATAIGRARGLVEEPLANVFWAALMRALGCTGFAHEETWYGAGDDIALRRAMGLADSGSLRDFVPRVVRELAAGGSPRTRATAIARMLTDPSAPARHASAQCDAATRLAAQLELPEAVARSLDAICERWDGKGFPRKLHEEQIDFGARALMLANVWVVERDRHGVEAARTMVETRAGTQFDPNMVEALLDLSSSLGPVLDQPSVWDAFLAAEPSPHAIVDEARIERVAVAFARWVDLKSTFTLRHSTGVARLAEDAAALSGHDDDARRTLRIAALLHDLGRVAVPNAIWDKPGPLNAVERERIRLHAYTTDRVLAQSAVVAKVARLAASAHERTDGSGYPRGSMRSQHELSSAILAAADAYHAMTELRPHRPAMQARDAARLLGEDPTMDPRGVRAVLDAAGQRVDKPRDAWPKGLTDREIDVLRLVARGRSNKEIASVLSISPRTVQHHTIHIYEKIGVESRAGAALFAMENDLVD